MAVHLHYSIVYLNLVAQVCRASLADALHENARQLFCNQDQTCIKKYYISIVKLMIYNSSKIVDRDLEIPKRKKNFFHLQTSTFQLSNIHIISNGLISPRLLFSSTSNSPEIILIVFLAWGDYLSRTRIQRW